MSDFNNDRQWSKQFDSLWDSFYKSDGFKQLLAKMRLKGSVAVKSIDRSENELFQKESYLDAVISLSTGSSLLCDEKNLRYPKRINEFPTCANSFPVEVCSNPNAGGKHDGWAYHIGTTICMVYIDMYDSDFFVPPVVFTISQRFIDEVVRNNDIKTIPSNSTNGLYHSVCKWVPRNVLEKYWP